MPISYTDPEEPAQVTTTSAQMVPANSCQGLLWISPIDGDIHIAFGRAATANDRKIAQGKHFFVNGYQVPVNAIHARSSSGTVKVSLVYG